MVTRWSFTKDVLTHFTFSIDSSLEAPSNRWGGSAYGVGTLQLVACYIFCRSASNISLIGIAQARACIGNVNGDDACERCRDDSNDAIGIKSPVAIGAFNSAAWRDFAGTSRNRCFWPRGDDHMFVFPFRGTGCRRACLARYTRCRSDSRAQHVNSNGSHP